MLIPVAKVLGLHGLKGEMRISPLGFFQDLLFLIKLFYLKFPQERVLEVETLRKGPGYNIFLVKFKNLDYEEAKKLIHQELYLKVEDLPPLEGEEFYFYQIIGLEVREKTKDKEKFWGKVVEVMPVGEYELLLVKRDKENFYLPLVEEYVEEVDFEKGIIWVKDIKPLVEVQS
ncbi:MAG: ribosome maturation factor RimM [Thermodesulfobacteriaceae bacterium]|nr:ribosome maturation factor RimM [Thermodesulfobacteriaceae bacterium]MCX8042414.1 ribosome maturation factor RimM [Thermodesulfobacteriaceae bacterium]MDW8135915.1 ribosome maturation factor RimM [Thermodesulfobacterium sp.]